MLTYPAINVPVLGAILLVPLCKLLVISLFHVVNRCFGSQLLCQLLQHLQRQDALSCNGPKQGRRQVLMQHSLPLR